MQKDTQMGINKLKTWDFEECSKQFSHKISLLCSLCTLGEVDVHRAGVSPIHRGQKRCSSYLWKEPFFTFNISDFNWYFVICHCVKLSSKIFERVAFHCCNGVITGRNGRTLCDKEKIVDMVSWLQAFSLNRLATALCYVLKTFKKQD